MAPEKLSEYERKRLENIKRNDEMLAALKIQSKAADLSAASKRQRLIIFSLFVFMRFKLKSLLFFRKLCNTSSFSTFVYWSIDFSFFLFLLILK